MKNTEATANTAANTRSTVTSDTPSELGLIKIHDNVLASLVSRAVLGVEGVSRLSGSQLVDIIAETVGSRRMQDRAIAVLVDEDGRTSIEIKLNLKFGYKIPEVSTSVQKAVISEVENTTGMTVTKVNVIVQELETQEEAEAAADIPAAEVILPPQH